MPGVIVVRHAVEEREREHPVLVYQKIQFVTMFPLKKKLVIMNHVRLVLGNGVNGAIALFRVVVVSEQEFHYLASPKMQCVTIFLYWKNLVIHRIVRICPRLIFQLVLLYLGFQNQISTHPIIFILMTKHGLNVTEYRRVKQADLKVSFVVTYPTGYLSVQEIQDTCYNLKMLLFPIMLISILILEDRIIQLNIVLNQMVSEQVAL